MGNLYIMTFVGLVLAMLAYDGFTTNEVDYWYPVRLCPRYAGGGVPSYAQLSPLTLPAEDGCRAATGVKRCVGRACVGDCEFKTSALECSACCGGVLEDEFAPCAFPFFFDRTWHRTCLAAEDGSSIHWCPTALSADGRPNGGKGGQCMGSCQQADWVAAPAPICGETQCSAGSNAPQPISFEVRADGFDGEAGFYFGAEYRLVLFAAADAMHLSGSLRTQGGTQLWRGSFERSMCRTPGAQRRRAQEEPADSAAGGEQVVVAEAESQAEEGLGRLARRRLLVRRDSWWIQLLDHNMTGYRRREGPPARWNGVEPRRIVKASEAGGPVQCAEEVVRANTLVAVQGGCDATSGLQRLPRPMLRAELGPKFVLQQNDFPLYLTVIAANASDRGEPDDPPQLYFSFYTEELDVGQRFGMWVGVPLSFLLLSCCLCCCCCLCCSPAKPNEEELSDKSLLAVEAQPLEPLDEPPAQEPPRRHLPRLRGGGRASAKRGDPVGPTDPSIGAYVSAPVGAYRINEDGRAVPDDEAMPDEYPPPSPPKPVLRDYSSGDIELTT